jgi:ABC-type lipoprotein release transport system permease subunit
MAVALSIAIITITMSMLSGFTSYIVDSTVENQPHVIVSPEEDEDYIYLYHGLLNYVQGQEGVIAVSPRYQGDSALQYRHNVEGAGRFQIPCNAWKPHNPRIKTCREP